MKPKPSFCMLFSLCLVAIQVAGQSPSYDIKLGAEGAKQMEAQIGLSNHPSANNLLDSIGKRLVRRLGTQPFTYEFNVLNQVEPNALTLPAGHIYFSRGILALANSEDELACVMGHEIIHAHKRHSIKAAKKGIIPSIIKLPGNLIKVVSPSLGSLINTPVEGVSELFTANYSRQNENEADYLGVRLAALSGYEPRALGSILTRINTTVEFLTGEKQKFSYFDSHPWTPDRVKNVERESASLTVSTTPHVTRSHADFLSKLDGIMISKDPAQGVLIDSLFLHPDIGFSLVLPPGWQYQNNTAAVVATEKNSEAQMMLGIAGPAADPKAYADKFLEAARKQGSLNITRNEELLINGHLGYIISMEEETKKGKIHAHVVWLNTKAYTFQFIGVGNRKHEPAMRESVLSFRKITEQERASIHTYVIRIASATEGETIEALGKRTGNAGSVKFTALINGLPENTTLKEGQLMKIIRKEVY